MGLLQQGTRLTRQGGPFMNHVLIPETKRFAIRKEQTVVGSTGFETLKNDT